MLPNQLTPASFAAYPPEARQLAVKQIALLAAFATGVPAVAAARADCLRLEIPGRTRGPRAAVHVSRDAGGRSVPVGHVSFRAAQVGARAGADRLGELPRHLFGTALGASVGDAPDRCFQRRRGRLRSESLGVGSPIRALPAHRLGIAVIGQGVAKNDYRLFRKLRPQGVYFTQVKHTGGMQMLLDAAAARAKAHPVPYGHWYIDGGASLAVSGNHDTNFIRRALRATRHASEPHAENLRGGGLRSRGFSHDAGADQAGRSRA